MTQLTQTTYVYLLLVVSEENVDYFFTSLNHVLENGIHLKTIEIILNFAKSKI